jgi:hypothetical protein
MIDVYCIYKLGKKNTRRFRTFVVRSLAYLSPVSSFLSLKARNNEKKNEIDRSVAVIRIFTTDDEKQK